MACGAPATDLHEEFITKAAVMMMSRERRLAINDPHNCVPTCRACHTANLWKNHKIFRDWIARNVGEGELDIGYARIKAWVDGFGLKHPPNVEQYA